MSLQEGVCCVCFDLPAECGRRVISTGEPCREDIELQTAISVS